MSRAATLGFSLVLVAACKSDATRAAAPANGAVAVVRAAPATGRPAASAAPEPRTCVDDSVARFPDPIGLAREYVKRDANAEFLQPGRSYFEMMDCGAEVSGGDEIGVAVDGAVSPIRVTADTAEILFTHRRLGVLATRPGLDGVGFIPQPRIDSMRATLLRTAYGWRFANEGPNPDVEPSALLRDSTKYAAGTADSMRAALARAKLP